MKDTLCWKCANACGGCDWSKKRAKPVEGWEAIRRDLYNGVESYIVLSCPQFIPDRQEEKKKTGKIRVWTQEETIHLHKMRENGFTVQQCAEILKRSKEAVKKKLIRDRKWGF